MRKQIREEPFLTEHGARQNTCHDCPHFGCKLMLIDDQWCNCGNFIPLLKYQR